MSECNPGCQCGEKVLLVEEEKDLEGLKQTFSTEFREAAISFVKRGPKAKEPLLEMMVRLGKK